MMKITVRKSFYDEYFNSLEKSHKYIRRWRAHNSWYYDYPKNLLTTSRRQAKIDIAKKTRLITGIRPLENATLTDVDKYIDMLEEKANHNELKCTALGNNNIYINSKTYQHFKETKGNTRSDKAVSHKAKYLPFVEQILKNGRISEKSSSNEGVIYGVVGQIQYYNKNEDRIIKEAVELAINYDDNRKKYFFSVSANEEIKKSFPKGKDFLALFLVGQIPNENVLSITNVNIPQNDKMSTPNITMNKSVVAEIMKTINERNDNNVIKSLTFSGWKLQGRTTFRGLNISIENRKGSIRRGTDRNGEKWAIKMNYDYGYIRGTEGVDGDHVDCYLGGNEDAKNVYIVHQNDPDTHKYDEDKCMLGFDTLADARKAYLSQYNKPGFLGKIDIMPFEDFKEKVVLKKNHGKKLITKSLNDYVKEIKSGFDFEMMKRIAL